MSAAMRLFAERGYEATSVGAIEEAAGLAPRSGALYQHFGGKEELLHAAIERELEAVDELDDVLGMLPLGDLRAELTLMARWNLGSLERRAQLSRFVRRDAERLPQELRDKLYRRLVADPYSRVIEWLQGRVRDAEAREPDYAALVLIMTESLSSYGSIRGTFGRVPDDVDDERLIGQWVELCLAYAQSLGLE